jgi:signal transduction histidine kinase
VQVALGMPNLPSTRQNRNTEGESPAHLSDPCVLAQAFATFTEAAGSLEKSYTQLQGEVSRLRADLEQANARLSRSLDENTRARAFLTQVLDRLPCGVLVSRPDGRIRLLNPEARRLLDLESQSHTSAELPIPAEWFSQAAPEKTYAEYEWASKASPEKRTLAVTVAALEAAPDAQPEAIWIVRDISEQKRAAAEREEIRHTKALAEIAAVLAHEIRNPLGSMELFTGLLGEATKQEPEAHQWVLHIQSGLRSLSATVNNVLQFHGKSRGELLPVRMDRMLEQTVQFLGPLAAAQGHSMQLENRIGPATVAADSHRLQQAFLNLAINGFRAMSQGGTLTIRLQSAPPNKPEILRIDFEDEGCGIEPDLLEEIFEPGFTTKAGSPGLGLSVCKKVVEEHGGSICVESCLDCGSTFTVYLAASEEVSE